VAVIDVGSNSGRVIVYQLQPGGHLHILAGSRAPLRLVRELDESHRLKAQALERAWEALADFRAIAAGAGAERILAVATAAMRDAENGRALLERAEGELGIQIRILAGEEEARYGFEGAVRGLPVAHGVLFDLGGGSLQVSRFRARRLVSAVSLPLGSLRTSDEVLESDPPSASELKRLREHVRKLLKQAGVEPLERGERRVGTGGTLRNLAKIDRRAQRYPISRLHGYVLARKAVRQISGLLAGRRLKKRERVRGLNQDRGDSIVGGSLVVEVLMEVLGADAVVVSGQGVREGLAASLLGGELPAPEAARAASVAALVARFATGGEAQARRRRQLVERLYPALELEPSPEVGEALLHAATVLDVGRSVDFFDRHEHIADIVLATDLAGFSHREVALLSAILRRAGDEDASPKSYAPLIQRDDRPAIERAAAVLALADDIEERCPPGRRVDVACRITRDKAVVGVPALAGWRPRSIGRRFERAFGRRLVVQPGPLSG
jgi:exopolyphosphatase/guanosine-5'-triphosphate,3'-diphosphate pyrophosphatase